MTSILHFFALFAVSTFIHELGHYFAAKILSAKVIRLFIGSGPSLVSWRNCAGERFTLCWFPIGGAAVIPQLSPDMRWSMPAIPRWRRVAILAAGPAANLLLVGAFALAGQEAGMRLNLALAGLNLLPISILDGGQIWRVMFDRRRALQETIKFMPIRQPTAEEIRVMETINRGLCAISDSTPTAACPPSPAQVAPAQPETASPSADPAQPPGS